MRLDWNLLLTIFLAIVLARIFEVSIMENRNGGIAGSGTKVSAEVHSPAEPVVVYRDPLEQYLQEHYPGAR